MMKYDVKKQVTIASNTKLNALERIYWVLTMN